jgi:hypothetical protein
MIEYFCISLLSILVENVDRQVVKTASDGVYVHKRQRVGMRSVGKKYENAFFNGIYP